MPDAPYTTLGPRTLPTRAQSLGMDEQTRRWVESSTPEHIARNLEQAINHHLKQPLPSMRLEGTQKIILPSVKLGQSHHKWWEQHASQRARVLKLASELSAHPSHTQSPEPAHEPAHEPANEPAHEPPHKSPATQQRDFPSESHRFTEAAQWVRREIPERSLEDLLALHLGLLHAPLTLLTGPPGTGKSSLLTGWAQAMGMKSRMIQISPAWRDQRQAIGQVSPIDPRNFLAGPIGEAMIEHALERPDPGSLEGDDTQAMLIILDEINLATPEHLLSGVISAMGSSGRTRGHLQLITQDEAARLRDARLRAVLASGLAIDPGLRLAGTANDDHTTEPLSERLRDRSAAFPLSDPDTSRLILQGIRPEPRQDVPPPQHQLNSRTMEHWAESNPNLQAANLEILATYLGEICAKLHHPESGLYPGARSTTRAARMAARALDLASSHLQLEGDQRQRAIIEREMIPLALSVGLAPTLIQRARAAAELQDEPRQTIDRLYHILSDVQLFPPGCLALRTLR